MTPTFNSFFKDSVTQFGDFVQWSFLFLSFLDISAHLAYPFSKGVIYLRIRNVLLSILGGGVLAFGLYNVHSLSGVTEGGALGLTLLLQHWLNISPAWSGLVINFGCYAFGLKTLGKKFLLYSAISGGSFSAFYAVFEQFPRLWPELAGHPLLAAFIGAIFVGVGCGLCVRAGGAPTGDDALAMGLSARLRLPIERVYLITDLTVLMLSGKLIGIIQRWGNS